MMEKQFKIAVIAVLVFLAWGNLFASSNPLSLDDEEYQKAFMDSYRLARKGQYNEAIEALKSLYEKDSYDYPVVIRLAYLQYQSGDYASSVYHYAKAAKIKPEAIEPLLGMINPLLAQKEYENVKELVRSILVRSPQNTTALAAMGYCFYIQEDYAKAVNYYRKVVDLFPLDTASLGWLGWAYLKSGDTIKAGETFRKILLVNPNNKSALEGYRKVFL